MQHFYQFNTRIHFSPSCFLVLQLESKEEVCRLRNGSSNETNSHVRALGGRWNSQVKSKNPRKMREFIVKCCGRQSCNNNNLRTKKTISQTNASISRKLVESNPPNQPKSTVIYQLPVEESSQPTSTNNSQLFMLLHKFNSKLRRQKIRKLC